MEQLGNKFSHVGGGPHYTGERDLFKFFALEVVLITVASLIRHQRWASLRQVMSHQFVVARDVDESRVLWISAFDVALESLDRHRNHRLKLNRLSVSADTLRGRCSDGATPFSELMQADVFLALDSAINFRARNKKDSYSRNAWVPRTTVYGERSGALDVFLRAHNEEARKGIWRALGVTSGADFRAKYEDAFKELEGFRFLTLDQWGRANISGMINPEVLMT